MISTLSPLPVQKFFDSNGNPLVGGLLFTYVAGTSNKIATYTDSTGLTVNTNPIVLDYRGECRLWLDPALTYKLVLSPRGDTDPPTKPIWTVDNISGGAIFYPVIPAETAAGVMVVNYLLPPCYVDRYKTNLIPGTTDMAQAFSDAYAVAKQGASGNGSGPVRWGISAIYRTASPINCTQMRGVISYDESNRNLSANQPSILVDHDGQTYSHGFDLAASTEMTFNDVCVGSAPGRVPNSVFFCARPASATGAGIHVFRNFRTAFNSTFRNLYYGYGSEENCIGPAFLYNQQGGSSCININCTNPSAYTSFFVTIATGQQSNAGHYLLQANLFNLGNSGSANEVCVSVERAENFSWLQGLGYCPKGLAYVVVSGTTASNYLTMLAIRGETDGTATTRAAVAVRTTAATGGNAHAHWKLDQVAFQTTTGGYLLDCNTTSDIADLSVRNCTSSSGNLVFINGITYSVIENGQQVVTGQATGTVSNTEFLGNRANITLAGPNSQNVFLDLALGEGGFNGIRFPATQVPSANVNTLDDYEEGTFTPTLTFGSGSVTYTTQTGTYTKVGRLVVVQIGIIVNVVSVPGGTLKVSGLPFTTSATLKGSASVFANGLAAAATTQISSLIDAAATTISLFKYAAGTQANLGGDVVNGSNFYLTASYET